MPQDKKLTENATIKDFQLFRLYLSWQTRTFTL